MTNLRNLREERKITMAQLADILHLSESTVSLYENGKREPSFDTLKKIARHFNVTIDYLLDFAPNEQDVQPQSPQMIASILKQLILETGKNQKEIAAELNLSPQRFNFYVTGRSEPDLENLSALADYFGVSVDYLLGRTAPAPARSADSILTPAEQELIERYRRASGDDRTIVDAALRKYKIPSRAEQVG